MTSIDQYGSRTESDDYDLVHRLEVFVDENEPWGKNASFRPVIDENGIFELKEGAAILHDLHRRDVLDSINEAITDIDLDAYDQGKIGEIHVYSDDTFEIDV